MTSPENGGDYNPFRDWINEQVLDYERLSHAARGKLAEKGPDDPHVRTALGEVQAMRRLITSAQAMIAAAGSLDDVSLRNLISGSDNKPDEPKE